MNSHSGDLPKVSASLRYDAAAGLVVFLVAVPLCLGIALASGAPLVSGLIAGMVGGLVIPFFSKAELSVSGPAAGLAAVVLTGIASLGGFPALAFAVMLAGLLQIGMGAIKAGKLSGYIPSGVVGGMLAAIGILLIKKQIPYALGWDEAARAAGGLGVSAVAVLVSVPSLGALLAWDAFSKKRGGSLIPAPLVAVFVGVAIHQIIGLVSPASRLPASAMVQIPSASELFGAFQMPDFALISRGDVWVMAVTIAVVASIESLLNVEAIDRLDPWERKSPMNRELVAQGVANAVSGLLGGLPVTSVVVRSSTGLQAGARTRGAAFIHGLLILISVLALGGLMKVIPLACLASILLATGYKLAGPAVMMSAWKKGVEHFVPFAVTVVTVVGIDLLKGVILGTIVAFAMAFFTRRSAKAPPVEVLRNGEETVIRFGEVVPFFARPALQAAVDAATTAVQFDGSRVRSIHADVLDVVRQFEVSARKRGVSVNVVGGVLEQT